MCYSKSVRAQWVVLMKGKEAMAKIDMLLQGFSLGTDQGNIGFCGVTLIEGTKRILVDVAHTGRRRLLLEALQSRGLTPGDIDYVFLTHSHWDHMLNIDLFPNARVLIHPKEREYCKNPHTDDWATHRYASMVLETHQLQEVREGEEIDDGVTVLETPGHSRGSMALLIKSSVGTAAVCGDALPNGLSVRSGMPRLVFWDTNEAKTSIRKLMDAASIFYPGHDRPFKVEPERRVNYLEATSIRIFGWPEGDVSEGGPGIRYAAEGLASTAISEPSRPPA